MLSFRMVLYGVRDYRMVPYGVRTVSVRCLGYVGFFSYGVRLVSVCPYPTDIQLTPNGHPTEIQLKTN